MDTIKCKGCGRSVRRTGRNQERCFRCSRERKNEKMMRWRKKNSAKVSKYNRTYYKTHRGAEVNDGA